MVVKICLFCPFLNFSFILNRFWIVFTSPTGQAPFPLEVLNFHTCSSQHFCSYFFQKSYAEINNLEVYINGQYYLILISLNQKKKYMAH